MRIGARNANLLFWLLLALILIFNLPRLLLTPTMSTGSDTSPVIITEFLARNQNGLVDDEGEHVDWIELYNRSAQAVNLEGWSLTDNPALPDKWRFPSLNLAPNGYLVVFASGKDVVRPQDSAQSVPAQPLILHTNFRLSGNGGFLALYAPTSRRYLETVPINYGPQRADVTYGRLATTRDAAQAAYLFFTEPTPGAPNSTTTAQLPQTAPVAFSRPHGLYNKMIDVALSTPTSGAAIWYTTDGSMPTPDHGERYVAPLTIATTTILRATAIMTDQLPSAVATQSYIFPIAVLLQPADPPGMPTTWGTHPISFGGGVAGQPVQADYAMDPRVTEDPVQQRQLLAGLQSLPSLSLVLPTADFAALYSDPQARGGEAEYAVSVELLPAGMTAVDADAPAAGAANPPANSGTNAAAVPAEDTFQIDAGIRIQGGAGRWEYMPKHSFRLFFKGIYGATKLPYRLFPNSPVNAFDTLVLRAGVDRSFAGHPDTPDLRQTTYTRDEWLRATQIAMSGVGSHGRFAHLYINGLYWGLYNVVERPDASFAAAYYGGNKDEWAAVNHGGSVSGPIDRFATLIRLAQEGGLADPTRYATMLEFIDPVQFSDYLIANWYAGNVDWPENNWYADVQYPAGRNLFFMWDGERTWDSGAVINLGSTGVEGAAFPNVIRLVFEALMENADFRLLFADRLYTHLAADGALSEGIVQERWRAITEPLAAAIVAESARWGDVRTETPITQEEWARASATVLAQMSGNGERLVVLARAAGYYPPLDPPQFAPRQQVFPTELQLAISAAEGEVYYTLDGTDPRTSTSAQRYREPLLLTTATTVHARARLQAPTGEAIWSALATLAVQRADQHANVRITEIMYHAPNGADYEYLELTNLGDLAADLSRAYFAGIDYRFGVDATLAPGASLAIVHDFRKFREQFAEREIGGIYSGELSNYGETITLFDGDGVEITHVRYSNGNGWPVTAGGQGDSVVLINPAGDPDDGSNWRARMVVP